MRESKLVNYRNGGKLRYLSVTSVLRSVVRRNSRFQLTAHLFIVYSIWT